MKRFFFLSVLFALFASHGAHDLPCPVGVQIVRPRNRMKTVSRSFLLSGTPSLEMMEGNIGRVHRTANGFRFRK